MADAVIGRRVRATVGPGRPHPTLHGVVFDILYFVPAAPYFAAFGISAFSLSMSLMFIFMPPGIMMSPAF